MDKDSLISLIENAHTKAAQERMPFQPTEHGYSNYQAGCIAMKRNLIAMLTDNSGDQIQEIFPGTLAALENLIPNATVQAAGGDLSARSPGTTG